MTQKGMGGCVVSRNILNGTGSLKWCIRESPIHAVDNGWRFLSDIDTDSFLADANNMVVCDWETVFEIEPAIMSIYQLPIGTDITLVIEDNKRKFVDTRTGNPIFPTKTY